jgi:hypothetical protein
MPHVRVRVSHGPAGVRVHLRTIAKKPAVVEPAAATSAVLPQEERKRPAIVRVRIPIPQRELGGENGSVLLGANNVFAAVPDNMRDIVPYVPKSIEREGVWLICHGNWCDPGASGKYVFFSDEAAAELKSLQPSFATLRPHHQKPPLAPGVYKHCYEIRGGFL